MLGLPEQAVGPVLAGFIAAIISLLGLLISKEQKVSEFRQAWIDAVREDVSAVIARGHGICGVLQKLYPDNGEQWVQANEAWGRLRLRLNPHEEPSQDVLAALRAHELLFAEVPTTKQVPQAALLDEADERLLIQSQKLLKKEWLRVRDGERVYRAAKLAAVFFVIVFGVWWCKQLFSKQPENTAADKRPIYLSVPTTPVSTQPCSPQSEAEPSRKSDLPATPHA